MVESYQKRPVIIEAIQFLGNDKECMEFCPKAIDPKDNRPTLIIPTLKGNMTCEPGDWIIKGIEGEFYPCKPSVFVKTYLKIEL